MALADDIYRELRFTAADQHRITNALFEQKVTVYQQTFEELATRYGFDPAQVELSSRIREEILTDARRSSELIVGSYNRDLRDAIASLDVEAAPRTALMRLEEWARQRAARSAPIVAITETYGPHADAQMAFFRNAGVQPDFDFGGHGDAAPACAICAAIEAGNPWPLEDVIAIGNPHPQCRQNWHPVKWPAIASSYRPGQGGTAGIVGNSTLIQRAGSRAAAVRAIEELK